MQDIEIIDNPKLKSIPRNITEVSITILMWVVLLYLSIPFLNIIPWKIDINYFSLPIIGDVTHTQLRYALFMISSCIAIVFFMLRSWGYYNYWRFENRAKHKRSSSCTNRQLADFFRIPLEQISVLKSSKEILWPLQKVP